jgi:protein SCO1/2
LNTVRGSNRGAVTAAAALLVCAAAPCVAGAARAHEVAPAARTPDAAAAPAVPQAARNRWGANYFPNVALTTQDGKTVRFYDDLLKGKSVAINVIFTDCKDVCPLETANLVQLKKVLGERVGRDIFLYSISIDPNRDTPEVLKAYAEKFGAGGPGWLFLTGRPEDIKLITKKLALIRDRDNPTSRDSHHAAYLIVGNEPTGQWTRNSVVDNPQFLAARMGTFLGWRDTQPQKSYAEARPLAIENGQRLFQSKCSACHTLGQGDKLGPDLAGVAARRERAWLTRYIQDPDEVLAAGDPIATALFNKYKKVGMPNLRLGSSDVAELVSFLEARSNAPGEKTRKDSARAD